MNRQAIYMSNGLGPDAAIRRGLATAGCEVLTTHDVAETLQYLVELKGNGEIQNGSRVSSPAVLVADVQAGAISLLKMIRERGVELPPTLLFDHEGSISAAIMALQLGVRGYMLASDPEIDREVNTYVIAGATETLPARTPRRPRPQVDLAISSRSAIANRAKKVEWVPKERMLRQESNYLRFSPVEAVIFDMLYASRGQVVAQDNLVRQALDSGVGYELGIRLLRPHMMRLRKKMVECAWLTARIINVRGIGYMLV